MAKKSSRNQINVFVNLVLIFLLSLLSFAVGTFVGKGVSESEYRKASLERGDYKRFADTGVASSNNLTEPLSEEEIDRLTKEFLNSEETKIKERKTAQNRPEKVKENGYQKEKRVVSGEEEKTQINVASSRKPSSPSVVAGSGTSTAKYTVQIASYATEAEALDHSKKLKTMGYKAFYIPAQVKGKTWYRVNVGRFPNESSAKDYRVQLIKATKIKKALVKKI